MVTAGPKRDSTSKVLPPWLKFEVASVRWPWLGDACLPDRDPVPASLFDRTFPECLAALTMWWQYRGRPSYVSATSLQQYNMVYCDCLEALAPGAATGLRLQA